MNRLCIDYETRSEVNVKQVGGVTYAQHPSTEIMCVGYKINQSKSRIWLPWADRIPGELLDAFNDAPEDSRLAHNALFEQCITSFVMPKYTKKIRPLPPKMWKCSAAKAAAVAIPRDLEGACLSLDLKIKKNMNGRKLMLKHAKPRSAWLKWIASGKTTNIKDDRKYFDDEDEREEIYSYCGTDVDAEDLLDRSLPDLIPFEREVWILNQEMNLRGVRIDVTSVQLIMKWIKEETKRLNFELRDITEGRVTTVGQRDKFLAWIKRQGIALPNLQAETVTKMIEMIDSGESRMVKQAKNVDKVRDSLVIRQQIGKSSLKKYPAMLKRISKDGRVKDYSMYHGASTGREAGRGLQLQNLVKGKIKNTDLAIEMINSSTLEEIRFLYGDPTEVFSSCVRGMIQASKGCDLFAADYNAIEARVLQWMAGDEEGLERFRKGIDSYVLLASKIFGISIEEVTSAMREVGKRGELGAGFGMGGPKFYKTCLKYGATNVTEQLCKRAINIFREVHPDIEKMWKNLEMAAIKAVRKPGRVVTVNRTSWQLKDDFLWCELPSGRKLAYYKPTVRMEPAPWGELTPKLYHWSVNPKTKKWENASTYGGKLTENVVQATARDVLMDAAVRLKSEGYTYLFSVHDEAISESKDGNIREYEKILMTLPLWADGLPIVAKGWKGPRYAKK